MVAGAKTEDETKVQVEPFHVSTSGRVTEPSLHSPTATHHEAERQEISRKRALFPLGGV